LTDKKNILDITITCPVNSNTRKQIVPGGTAAEVAHKKKVQKYGTIAEQNNLLFTPMVLESTGFMHKDMVALLRKVAGMDEKGKCNMTIMLYNYMMTTISVVLQKGLANAFLKGRIRAQGGIVQPAVQDHYSRSTIVDYMEGMNRNGVRWRQ